MKSLRSLCIPFARWLLTMCHEPYAILFTGENHTVELQSNIDRNILAEVLEQVSDKMAHDPDMEVERR